jgi:hypothetical protein
LTTCPFFIVGANRSGTTLLRLMLGAHPRLAVPDELMYFRHQFAGVDPRLWRSPGLTAEEYREFVRGWLGRTSEALPGLSDDALTTIVDELVELDQYDLREPYRLAVQTWAEHQGKMRWGEKTPGNLFFVDVLLDMFPEARFIHLVRDPRAGVFSMLKAGRFGPDPVLCALNRRRYVVEGGALLGRTVPPEQRMTLRYEDLVGAPERTARQLCAFLGETYDPAMLAFHQRSEEVMVEEAASDYNALATKPITTNRREAWKTKLAPSVQAQIDAVSKPVLAAYGYHLSGCSLDLSSAVDVAVKWTYWRWQAFLHRDERGYILGHPMFARLRSRIERLPQTLKIQGEGSWKS